ncbi:MAG: phosphomannose isomerase type II C-terminal cupin domain [Rhodospirillales bacterium]|nr:phosphomannose isomerase type II C-terminal cupin domain [Rhodospirillales bacterium]
MTQALFKTDGLHALVGYAPGDQGFRPWGWYEVLNVGMEGREEFCEKKIGIRPHQALSLQRHHGRREVWRVEEGELTVIVDGRLHTLHRDDTILIPLASAHCMMNLIDRPLIVYEKQMGLCREDDNDRLYDFNGRETVPVAEDDHKALESIELYKKVTGAIS